MQIVSNGDNLHDMSNLVFYKKNIINFPAELAKGEVMVKRQTDQPLIKLLR